mmetsp:Transcript_39126/g.85531  ORF Transcript_39126/g.85531 Transcript_39126/m.85531 type:complete len:283 (+) Transcript_39126:373-1221(+)
MLDLTQSHVVILLLGVLGREGGAEPFGPVACCRSKGVPAQVTGLHAGIVLADHVLIPPQLRQSNDGKDLQPSHNGNLSGCRQRVLRGGGIASYEGLNLEARRLDGEAKDTHHAEAAVCQLSLAVPRQQALVLGEAKRIKADIADVLTRDVVGEILWEGEEWQSGGVLARCSLHCDAAGAVSLRIASDPWVQVARRELLHQRLASHGVLSNHGGHGHHGEAAVVDLSKQLRLLGLWRQLVDLAKKGRVAIVCREAKVPGFQQSDEGKNLQPALKGNLVDGIDG